MCTVTLHRGDAGLCVTMNRDELRSRAPELGPRIERPPGGGPRWVAPRDGKRGGTWLGVNEEGLVALVLNGYAPSDLELLGRPGVPSRGCLVAELLAMPAAAAWDRLEQRLAPEPYPSFDLLVLWGERARLHRWRRHLGLAVEAVDLGWSMLSSSFWRADEVLAFRRQRFAEWMQSGTPHHGLLPAFNLLAEPGLETHSPLMSRPLTATRSITQVSVNRERATLRHWRRRAELDRDPTPDHELDLVLLSTL